MSLFIQDKIQSLDGTLYLNSEVPSAPNVQKPGTITYFKGDGAESSAPFAFKNAPPYVPAAESKRHAQAELIDYGDNMYHPNRIKRERPPPPTEAEETLELRKTAAPGGTKETPAASTPVKKSGGSAMDAEEEKTLSEKTKKGLNNLADLIGVSDSKKDDFKLNLFSEVPSGGASGGSSLKGIDNIITIDATDLSKKKLKDLEKEFGDLSISASADTGDSGQELLDLMDAAG